MNTLPRVDFLYLSEPDMIRAGVTDMAACVDTMEEMLVLLHAGDYRMAGANNDSHGAMVVFPEDSPFPAMPKPTADRRFMAMPPTWAAPSARAVANGTARTSRTARRGSRARSSCSP